jgi:hypothetical protein
VKSGKYDFGKNRGTLNASGGLRLKRGHRKVTIKAVKVTLGRRSRLVAKIGGRKVTLAVLSRRAQKVHHSGRKRTVSRIRVRLSRRATTLIRRKLRGRRLSARTRLATLRVQVTKPARRSGGSNPAAHGSPSGSPSPGAPATGSAKIQLAPALIGALATLGLDPAALPGTNQAPDGSLSLSVVSADIDPQTGQGTIGMTGGLTLGSGSNAVTITDPQIVIDGSGGSLYAQLNGVRTKLANLEQSGLAEKLQAGVTQLHDILLKLSPQAADALNQAGGISLFVPGTPFGDISLSLPGS